MPGFDPSGLGMTFPVASALLFAVEDFVTLIESNPQNLASNFPTSPHSYQGDGCRRYGRHDSGPRNGAGELRITMSLRGCFAAFVLTLCAFVSATDYELVVPNGWTGIKNSSSISLSDAAGKFKEGDRIVRIRSGVSVPGGLSVRLTSGAPAAKATLAQAGTVDGYTGTIVLAPGNGSGSGVKAFAMTTAIQKERPKPEAKGFVAWIADSLKGLPWGFILMGLGVVVVATAIFLLKKGNPEHSIGMPFGNKRVIEEGFRDVRARLENIIAAQTELVRKPPVLRTFRKDIENFHNRLHKLESGQQANLGALNNITAALASLEDKLGKVSEQCSTMVGDQRKASDALSKIGSDQAQISAAVNERTSALEKEVAASTSRLDLISHGIEKAEQERSALATKIDIGEKNNLNRFSDAQKTLKTLTTGLGNIAKSVDALQTGQAGLQEVPAALELANENIQEIQKNHKITVEQLTDLQSEFESLRMLIQSLNSEKQVMEQFGTLRSDFESLQVQIRAFSEFTQAKLETLSGGSERFESQLNELGAGLQFVGQRAERFENQLLEIGVGLEQSLGEKFSASLQESFNGVSASLQESFSGVSASLQEGLGGVTEKLAEVSKPVVVVAPAPEPVAEEIVEPEAEVVEEPQAEEIVEPEAVEEVVEVEAQEESVQAEEVEAEPVAEEVEEFEPVAEEEAAEETVELEQAAEEEVVEVEAEQAVELETVAEETLEEAVEEPETEPAAEPYYEEAPVVEEPVLELVNNESDDEEYEDDLDPLFLDPKDRWSGVGASTERRWSLELPKAQLNLKSVKTVKPLTPIETPGIEAPIGGMIYLGNGVAYGHGDWVRNFWPGRDDRHVQLESQIQSDPWRIMAFGGYLYNVADRRVEVVHIGTWSNHASFEGEFLAQTSTDSHWAGLLSWGGQYAVDFRDASGQSVGSPRPLDLPTSERIQVVASGKAIYVATQNGAIYKADLLGSELQEEGREGVELISVSLNRGSILTFETREGQSFARLYKEGHAMKELELGIENIPCPPVIIEDKFYTFDEKTSELVIGSLRGFKQVERKPFDNILGVRKMVGLRVGKTHLLGVVATDENQMPVQAMVIDVKNGTTTSLGMVNMPKVDMIVAGGHFVLATSCSYQNTLSVFDPFEAEEDVKVA